MRALRRAVKPVLYATGKASKAYNSRRRSTPTETVEFRRVGRCELIGGRQYVGIVNSLNNKTVKTRMWPMPNVMAALPNTGGALCSTPQSLADADYYAVQ